MLGRIITAVVLTVAVSATASAQDHLKTGESFRDCPECPEMVVIPAGSFTMGVAPGEEAREEVPEKFRGWAEPRHPVTIGKSFSMGKYEVTFAEWDACVEAGGCKHRPKDQGWGRGDRPVIYVSWDDTKAYMRWLSQMTGQEYRLPNEAEWEYAARAGTTTAYWWGEMARHEYANYGKFVCCGGLARGRDQWRYTAPAGSFSPNGFGLHDVHGNVWEWVEDCWQGNFEDAPSDGTARTTGSCVNRVVRGGSWFDTPRNVRAAYRLGYSTGIRHSGFGFRVARTLQ